MSTLEQDLKKATDSEMAKLAPLTMARNRELDQQAAAVGQLARAASEPPRVVPRLTKQTGTDHLMKAVTDMRLVLGEVWALGAALVGENTGNHPAPTIADLDEKRPLVASIHVAADELQLLAGAIRDEINRIRSGL